MYTPRAWILTRQLIVRSYFPKVFENEFLAHYGHAWTRASKQLEGILYPHSTLEIVQKRRTHLVRYKDWWNDKDTCGGLDELLISVFLNSSDELDTMNPTQLLNAI